jgi:hypothetical protein
MRLRGYPAPTLAPAPSLGRADLLLLIVGILVPVAALICLEAQRWP